MPHVPVGAKKGIKKNMSNVMSPGIGIRKTRLATTQIEDVRLYFVQYVFFDLAVLIIMRSAFGLVHYLS
jgi:hypothetical protein